MWVMVCKITRDPDNIYLDVLELWSHHAEDDETVEEHGEGEVGQRDLHDQGGAHSVHLIQQALLSLILLSNSLPLTITTIYVSSCTKKHF